ISNLGPGNLAIRFGLKGVNYTTTSACASATHAIGESLRMIRDGIQDVMITGGAESTVTPLGIGGFCSMKALSTRNDEPTKASRPFDRDRDGFVLGEGAAILVLESLEHAEARGANILAELIGYGFSCDAYHITAPSADGEGAISCMKMALEDASLSPEEVTYVNAHGTSTEANDQTETLAIKEVFGPWAKEGLLVSSTKSMTGHLLGAAGAIEGALVVKAIEEGMIPPTINLDNPDDGLDLDYVPHTARKTEVKAAISNSFGFGGTNATVVFKQFS
ncbi:MAG: beta-ketoacyl-ACP synthase II, partial [Bdellovibrionales bacterium]|nr:beta-ketoacyl-ACP synthase II [Bdellovibrionales bacterium]